MPRRPKAPFTEGELAAAKRISEKHLTEEYTWDNNDFELMTTMRYEPTLYRGPLPFLEALESDPLDASFFFLLGNHVKRINNAAAFFGFCKGKAAVTEEILLPQLTAALRELGPADMMGPVRIRVTMNKVGKVAIVTSPIDPQRTPLNTDINTRLVNWTIYVDSEPTKVAPFTSFKTTRRDAYNAARERMILPGAPTETDVLLYSTGKSVLETSIGNVAFQRDIKNPLTGQVERLWVTPPLSAGCMEGTVRRWLIETEQIVEEMVPLKTVSDGETIMMFNGVRGIVKARLVKLE